MTRVSSFGQNQALLQGIFRNQQQLFEAQRQVNTGKQSDEYRGIADETSSLVAGKTLLSRTEAYEEVTAEVGQVADVYDVQLGLILESARNVRQQILTFISNNDATGFDLVTAEDYGLIVNALNTKVGNKFIFSGATASTPPINALDIDALQALPAVADAFDNDPLKAKAKVSDTVSIEYGQTADDVAAGLFQVFRDLADYSDGPQGPLSGELNAAQSAFLASQLAALDTAITGIQEKQMENGLHQRRLDSLQQRHADQKIFLETFISDIEDVDITAAITRLNNSQTALEASYRVVSQTVRLSIIDFI